MNSRELKGLEIAARQRIYFKDGVWIVPSQAGDGLHKVRLRQGDLFCDCEDFELRQEPCKHIVAARLVQERDHGGKASPIDTDTLPEKRKYPRNWPVYDLAQTTEKRRFQVLLADLCAGFRDPPASRRGRKLISTADRLFYIVFKVYCGLSSRRYMTDLDDACQSGHIEDTVGYSKICWYFREAHLTDALRDLVSRSALPLRAIETNFAVDSSGFSVGRFVRWIDEKYGSMRSGRDWVKVHICTGCKTNIVTAVEIKSRDASDCPLLPNLLYKTAEKFRLGDVTADKGYLSAENVEVITELGGTPFIAPKSNTTGGVGGLFEKMYHFYKYQREEFLARYHKRSNVESTFSAVKRKFGDHVRSRDPVGMVNEALCKFICHNLCCVIRSQIELGIEADFWDDKDVAQRDVIPLVRRI